MPGLTVVSPFADHVILVKLAREIAINHAELPDILARHGLTATEWERLKDNQDFMKLLEGEIIAWQAAANTHERTRLKAAAVVEEWLPEANRRIHDKDEALSSKVEVVKLLARVAEMGLTTAVTQGGGGEKFVVNINLGGNTLTIEKTAPPLIEAQAIEG